MILATTLKYGTMKLGITVRLQGNLLLIGVLAACSQGFREAVVGLLISVP